MNFNLKKTLEQAIGGIEAYLKMINYIMILCKKNKKMTNILANYASSI